MHIGNVSTTDQVCLRRSPIAPFRVLLERLSFWTILRHAGRPTFDTGPSGCFPCLRFRFTTPSVW